MAVAETGSSYISAWEGHRNMTPKAKNMFLRSSSSTVYISRLADIRRHRKQRWQTPEAKTAVAETGSYYISALE
jgi:hypothetical protein